ncbi:PLDc_N domain-containing protein [Cryobacterium frigoriphilum]|uniref:PLDc_N domain-containing protein n=1 Tax=Cryobacterium frigoriphilum TaxID=1259150 RepID=A0A4R8ZUL1_9MICO|nr:PLD nuclease N-terminal domain-containing protein [Cryobacterium frigoriphilum]TFD46562.1 PLDc_N domain-containing protein [Cryobacterium frigoriphilum]
MPRLLFGLGLIVIILTVYALVDCALFDRSRIRGLPRWVWIFVIILVPVIGPLLWLFVGRGRKRAPVGRMPRTSAPDDDPEFLRGLDREKKERERIRRLEDEFAKLDDADGKSDGKPGKPGKPGPSGATGSAGTTGVDPKKSDPGEGDLPGRRDA